MASVAGADGIWEISASCQVGSVSKGTYIVSFTAWTDSGSYALLPGLQESGGDYTTFTTLNSSTISLTTTPTQYSLTADVSIAGNAQATFGCAQQTGTFHIKGVSVTAAPASTLAAPSISSISYDSTTAKTTVTFPSISGAEYVYLYESTTNDPSTASLICTANQSQTYWTIMTRKEVIATFNNTGSPVTAFTITGYSTSGTYYYWISGQKDKESESAKSAAALVSVSGSFSNYASIPTNADCRSLNDNWNYTITSTGTDTPQFFYAASGMPVTISGNSSDSAKVGIKVYLASATPSYILGDTSNYNYSWQTTAENFTTTVPGYYVIERYNSSTGSYGMSISSTSASTTKSIIAPSASRSAGTEGKILMLNRR